MLNIAVLVSGGGTNLQAIIDSINKGIISDVKISCVISNKKDAYALERAERAGIEGIYLSPKDYDNKDAFGDALSNVIKEHDVGLVVLAGYLVVLPKNFVNEFSNRIINIHPSLIPSFCGDGYYGLKVHEKALERGVKVTGATVHFVDDGTDTGPIILQKAVEILDGDTPEVLQKRVMEQAEWVILPKAIQMFAHGKIKGDDKK